MSRITKVHKITHFPKCASLCIIQRLQVLGAPCLPFVFITASKTWCACKISIRDPGIVLLGRDFFRLYTCDPSACTCTCGCIGGLRLPQEEIVVRRVSQGAKKWCPHPKTCP